MWVGRGIIVRDAIDAMKLGLDVLLEKPLAHNLRDAKSIVTFSQLKQRSLAVVNEFSFLPAFNFVSELISNNQNQLKSIKIDWFDVPNEVRHGLIKRHHEEVSYIQDIVPHCISILGVFVSGLEIEGKKMPSSLNRGVLSFRDDKSRLHTFSYNNNCDARKRGVAVETNTALITIDFSEKKSRLLVQGKHLDTPKRTEFLDSTLRLQLGAFLFNRGYKNLQNLESVYFHMGALDKFI